MTSEQEKDFLRQYKADPSEWRKEYLLGQYAGLVRSFARRVAISPEEMDDFCQEGRLTVLALALTYNPLPDGSFKCYLKKFLRWKMLELCKARNRYQQRYCLGGEVWAQTLSTACTASDLVEVKSQRETIAECIAKLTPTQQLVIKGILSGETQVMIAKAIGCTPANVAYLKRVAYDQLRAMLTVHGY